MSTTQSKLMRLIEIKTAIKQKLIDLRVEVPENAPFKDYPDLIKQVGGPEFIETTIDQELLQMIDLYKYLSTLEYEEHVYTDEELQKVSSLLNLVIEGNSIEPEVDDTRLFVSVQGKTKYIVGETFSLEGYSVYVVYNDGSVINVTSDCSFSPNSELTSEDKYITISYNTEDIALSVKQPITVNKNNIFVEYLQSTGTQYIDTKIVPKTTTRVVIDLEYTSIESQYMGWGSSGSKEAFTWGVHPTLGFVGNVSGNYASDSTNIAADTSRHIFDLKKGSLKFDGTEFATTNTFTDTAENDQTMYLFAQNAEWTTELYSPNKVKIYSCQIYDGNTLVRDYKPYLDSSRVYCLYDKVEGKCYYSQGTEGFLGGKEII